MKGVSYLVIEYEIVIQSGLYRNIQLTITEQGFTKYQSNVERHRTMIGTTRNDIDYSAKYAVMEDQFIKIATKDKEFVYKMNAAEKECLDSYMASRNGKLLFSKGNFDANGKTTLQDELGRPIIATEGKGICPYIQ